MNNKQTTDNSIIGKGIVVGIVVGSLVGLAVGALVGNWRVWVSFGASLGFAVGLVGALVLAGRDN